MAATNLKEIAEHIRNMKFRRKLFGGVDEADVWRQIKELDADYRNLFKIQTHLYQRSIAKTKAALTAKAKTGTVEAEAGKTDATGMNESVQNKTAPGKKTQAGNESVGNAKPQK